MAFILSTPTNQAQVMASISPNMTRALYVGNTIVGGTTQVGNQTITSINTTQLPTGNMSYAFTNQSGSIVGGFTNIPNGQIIGNVLGQTITPTQNTSSFVVPNASQTSSSGGGGAFSSGGLSSGGGLDLTIPLLLLGGLLLISK
jgi:uncharacterized membrane protein YgcG